MAVLILIGVIAFLLLLFLSAAVKVAREYERGVVFRLGRLLQPPKGPGLFLLIPVIDRMVRVDLRTITLNVPPQEVITKDNVPVRVNAVAYFRIVDPSAAIVQVENFMVAIVEVKDVEIPAGMQRAMARQAEAERERRAKVISAEGEFQASERLKDAAEVMSQNPISLQLRYLQTMLEMSSERTSTLILPLPIELIGPLVAAARGQDGA